MAIFGKSEIVLGKPAHWRAVGVRHIDEDVHQFYIDLNRRRSLRIQINLCDERKSKCRQHFHDLDSPLISVGKGSPSAQTTPSSKCSFFQMGTVFLSVSMSQRQASKAAERCADATAI